MSTKYIKKTEDDLEIIMKSSLSVEVDRCHLAIFYDYMCFLEYRFIGDNNDWFSSISDIVDYSGFQRPRVVTYIKCLEELGLLRVIREKYTKETGKRSSTNRYKILGSTMNHGNEEKGSKCEEQASPRQENKPQAENSHPNPNPPETNNKAIESQPEVKDETPTPHIVNSGVDDNRASKIIFNLYGFGMDENEWLRALGSRSRRQVNKCRAKYMGFVPQSDRDYLDDYIDNILKVA